jgi:predicted DNA-binding ribbon-helix-helix protein
MRLDRRRRKPPIKSLVVKQSVSINGHHSSVSIEGAFWKALKEIAVAQNMSANALISKIDNERGDLSRVRADALGEPINPQGVER